MVAAMADNKAAREFHTRSHGITGISTQSRRRVKVNGLLEELIIFSDVTAPIRYAPGLILFSK
jgi:hypothetical protein